MVKESHWGQMHSRRIPGWRPGKVIVWSCESESWIVHIGDPKMLEIPEPRYIFWGDREWNQSKRQKCVVVRKAGRVDSSLTSDMMLQNLEYTLKGINIDLVWYSLITHEFIHSFWKGYVYSVPLYIAILSFAFWFYKGIQLSDCLESQKGLCPLEQLYTVGDHEFKVLL